MNEAYIVAGYRSAINKTKKGGFRFYRPDDLARRSKTSCSISTQFRSISYRRFNLW